MMQVTGGGALYGPHLQTRGDSRLNMDDHAFKKDNDGHDACDRASYDARKKITDELVWRQVRENWFE
jgi:hypothetical protein